MIGLLTVGGWSFVYFTYWGIDKYRMLGLDWTELMFALRQDEVLHVRASTNSLNRDRLW
jgi:hypothetical protein